MRIQKQIITVLVNFITPSFELIINFSDGGRWFEFEWVILWAELQIQIYLGKSRNPKESKSKSQICKKFSDCVKWFCLYNLANLHNIAHHRNFDEKKKKKKQDYR